MTDGRAYPSEKYWLGLLIPNIWKNKTCSKPPTRSNQYVMWVKQCHKPSPSHNHFINGGIQTIPKWVVYDIVLTTLCTFIYIRYYIDII